MKIIFMGTPDFAVASLKALVEAGHEIILAVTQPDKEKGRGKQLAESDVKRFARENNIPVYQPVRIRNEECVEYLKSFSADIVVVAAFGQILPKSILDMPRLGCINVHASLLPKYRGAAPIQWSVINGDDETGVTIMKMAEGLDTGDIIMSRAIPITEEDTGGSMFDKLAVLGGELLCECLDPLDKGTINPIPQDEGKSSYASMLTKEIGKINWNKTSKEIGNLVRGCNPWPGTYVKYNGKTMKIWKAVSVTDVNNTDMTAGMVAEVGKDYFVVKCAEGSLRIEEVQLEGKKRMSVHDFLLGYKINLGEKME